MAIGTRESLRLDMSLWILPPIAARNGAVTPLIVLLRCEVRSNEELQ